MSSGLPPILAASQPTATNGFSFNNGFTPFGFMFPTLPQGIGPAQNSASAALNRFKVKRHRQRVDAGEPRNTYQGTSSSSSSNTSTSSTATSSMPSSIFPVPTKKEEEEEEEDEEEEAEEQQENLEMTVEEEKQKTSREEEDVEDGAEEDFAEREESPGSNSSAASKRKSFLPQKIGEQLGIEIAEEPEQIQVSVGASEDTEDVTEEAEPEKLTALQTQLQHGNLAETQRRIYMTFLEQQRRSGTQKFNYEQLVAKINNEVMNGFMKTVDKIVREWAAEQEVVQTPVPPVPFHPIFPANPLFHLPNPHPMGAGGIFPPNFNAFNAFNALRRNLQESSESETKRKKARMEVKKEDVVSSRASPLSASASPPLGTSTPLSRFFPAPTMVGHPYGSMNFCGDREDSPTNSDELSDSGFEGSGSSSMLTPMHLRKAKLMFFYTRYPNSNLLKSYFPDIRFNKANTAQLVKWFSNFREFYYIQMEKFGRQLLAEGVRDRSEIFVTKNSELFKVLNTHYNRNNHIEPPDNLVRVVQETLREFYDAIKLGKDAEPSWKKTIYKVINRMDDPIPDGFKDPNFLGSLE